MITKILQRIRCFIYVIGKIFAIMPLSARDSTHPVARGAQGHQLPLKGPGHAQLHLRRDQGQQRRD
jgi:hypothetical protein